MTDTTTTTTARITDDQEIDAIRVLRDACREQGAALLVVSHDPALESHFARIERLSAMTAQTPAAGAAR